MFAHWGHFRFCYNFRVIHLRKQRENLRDQMKVDNTIIGITRLNRMDTNQTTKGDKK